MSGHNKWSQIKHQKATADLRRGREFSKLSNAIAAAAKQGGGDPQANVRLRLLLENARKINMPKDNLDKAIKRGTGQLPGIKIEEFLYEIFGPSGIAILAEAATDNKNRTTSEIRSVLNRFGGKIASSGAVSHLFEQQGAITVDTSNLDSPKQEELELKAIDAGAQDIEKEEGRLFIYTFPHQLEQVKRGLEEGGVNISEAKLSFEPKTTVPITDKEKASQILKLMEALEEIEDVTAVYANFDIPSELV